MKTTMSTLLVLMLCLNSLFAAVLTVSNWSSIPAQFTDLPSAFTAANPGDTLYVHGSPNTYGSVTLSKSLTLIGPGYFPSVQNSNQAEFSGISISSTIPGAIDNIRLIGLNVSTITVGNSSVPLQNFAINRCFITNITSNFTSGQASSLSIQQSIFTGTINLRGFGSALVSNCLFTLFSNITSSNTTNINAVINNCTFSSPFATVGSIANTIFSNNIFDRTTISTSSINNCVFTNNLTVGTTNNTLVIPTSTTSGTLVNQNPLFVLAFASTPNNIDAIMNTANGNYLLQNGSPAKNAGTDGTDIGFTGGTPGFNYLTQSNSPIPQLQSLIINNAAVPQNGVLNIQFSGARQD